VPWRSRATWQVDGPAANPGAGSFLGVDRPGADRQGRIGHDQGMSSAAELSSLSSSMEELHRRVTAMAEGALNQGDEDMAHELIAVERALGGALRRLQRYAAR
jgi:hypothetical protein